MKKVLLLTADADNGLGTAIRDAVRGEAEVVRLPERTTGGAPCGVADMRRRGGGLEW
ncbi:hypothetical protein [Rhodococcus erythropolis]|uniref:hypothetical protein n=1 Tax=Rhodococcus erythropolis TaxID=1833 RepID=UPI000A4C53DD|nr:hypothetical protein [Rhodococcus erythropolis]